MPDLKAIAGSFRGSRSVPGQYTTDRSVVPDAEAMANIASIARARVERNANYAADATFRKNGTLETDEYRLIAEIRDRKGMLESEQARLRTLFRRFDNLYHAEAVTLGGADHWPQNQRTGQTHISVNTPRVYVDIPAALQAVTPVENYVASSSQPDERDATDRRERLYFGWKEDDEFELKGHRACIDKGLYGITYGKVFWDSLEKRPTVQIIDSPENLYVGWGASDFSRMDYAIYCYGLSPQAVEEEFGLVVDAVEGEKKGTFFPYVRGTHDDPIGNVYGDAYQRSARPRPEYERMDVEVYDYWYKKPEGKGKRASIWNCIYVGNALVKNKKHPEYDDLPYIPLRNTFIPGLPYGHSELYDMEQLFREKDERLTEWSAVHHQQVNQKWQLTGQDAPDEVPSNLVPQSNKVIAPGPGNRIEPIAPHLPAFESEALLKRIDGEMEVVSGLNPVLLGRAPGDAANSSKAIAALIAQYEARIRMRRDLYYQWRKRIWKMAAQVWEAKDKDVADLLDKNYRLDVKPPELNPRDELEVAQMAQSLVQNRIWSMARAMNATGVEDPTDEKSLIREEQTDPALNPQAVTQQATLFGTFSQLGITPPQQSQAQAQNAVRQLSPGLSGSQSLNAPENQGVTPQEALPANAQHGGPNEPKGKAVLQTLVNGEGAQGRVLTSTPLG